MQKHPNLPNFIIIGAGRSGTTSLYYYLKQHPEITMSPIKETNFFAYDPGINDRLLNMDKAPFPVKRLKAYYKLFNNKNDRSLPGEASPMYLWHPSAPKNIYQSIPDVKLIVILRNPVDRIYSSFWLYVSLNMEKRTLVQAIAEEKELKIKRQWPSGHMVYISEGFYYHHLCRFQDYFPREQIKIYFYDDFKKMPLGTVKNIFDFLGVPGNFIPNTSLQHNSSGRPKNKVIQFLLRSRSLTKRIRRFLPGVIHDPIYNYLMRIKNQNLSRPPLDNDIRKQLIDIYHDDIIQLGNFVNRDLSHWLRT